MVPYNFYTYGFNDVKMNPASKRHEVAKPSPPKAGSKIPSKLRLREALTHFVGASRAMPKRKARPYPRILNIQGGKVIKIYMGKLQ